MVLNVYDITNFINWFRSQFFTILTSSLSILNSFQFNGFSLLSFILALGLLQFGIPIFISVFKPKREKSNKGGSK